MGFLGRQAGMAEAASRIVSIEQAANRPYSQVLAYPASDDASVQSRIRQLEDLRLTSLVFEGPLKLDGLSLLGKGVSSVVMVGIIEGRRVALKIRRVDSRRKDMSHESEMLQAANLAGVGPKYLGETPDVLAMELVEGQRLPIWLSGLKGRGRKPRVRMTVRTLLEQCRTLDHRGLDHGELSRAHKNILVAADDYPSIVDFESASLTRRPSNFTSLTQYLFLGGGMARRVGRVLGPISREPLLAHLRDYKAGKPDAFHSTIGLLNLHDKT